MSWNYRIVQHHDGSFGLHEVYYHADGKPRAMTDNPVAFTAHDEEGPSGIISSLTMALADAQRRPVLIEAEAFPRLP